MKGNTVYGSHLKRRPRRKKLAELTARKLAKTETVQLKGLKVRAFRHPAYELQMRHKFRERVYRSLEQPVEVQATYNKRGKLIALTVRRLTSIPA